MAVRYSQSPSCTHWRAVTSAGTISGPGGSPSSSPARSERFGDGQAGASAAFGLGEHVQDRGAVACPVAGRGARGQRDPVGDREADAEQAGQRVGVGGDPLVGAVAVVVMDAPGQVGETVGGEQQVQPAGHPQPLPGLGRLPGASPGQAGGSEGALRV